MKRQCQRKTWMRRLWQSFVATTNTPCTSPEHIKKQGRIRADALWRSVNCRAFAETSWPQGRGCWILPYSSRGTACFFVYSKLNFVPYWYLIWWYGPNYCLFSFLNRFWVFSFLYLCWFYMLLPDSAFEVSMLWHVCLGNCFCRLASRSWQAGGLPCVNKEYRAILTFDIWWFCATYLFVWMWVLTQHAMLVFDSFLLANPISGHEPAFLL